MRKTKPIDLDTKQGRLRWARSERGFYTAKEAAEAMGVPYGTYSGHESGTRGIRDDEAERYAKFFGVPAEWLAFGRGKPRSRTAVPIMGFIGAGAQIQPEYEQVPPEGLATVDLPFPIPEAIIGLEVRGDSMLPRYDDGDVVLVYEEQQRAAENYLGEEAAVRTADGFRYLKRLARGPSAGTFNLESFNARTIEGVHLDWVGEIYLTVRAGQIRRIESRERAAARRRALARERETTGMSELPFEPGES